MSIFKAWRSTKQKDSTAGLTIPPRWWNLHERDLKVRFQEKKSTICIDILRWIAENVIIAKQQTLQVHTDKYRRKMSWFIAPKPAGQGRAKTNHKCKLLLNNQCINEYIVPWTATSATPSTTCAASPPTASSLRWSPIRCGWINGSGWGERQLPHKGSYPKKQGKNQNSLLLFCKAVL